MTIRTSESPTLLLRRLSLWAARAGLANKLALALTVAAVVAGLATYGALTESPPLGHDPDTVYLLLNIDLVILLLLAGLIARRLVGIWVERRRGRAGSRLHVRLVVLLSALAVTPAIIVAGFSAFFFYFGVQSWFSERVSTAVNESVSVAQAYLQEHRQVLRADALAMANDLNREAPRLMADEQYFNQYVSTQALLRDLTEAMVIDGTGQMLARSGLTFLLQFEPISDEALAQARAGEVVELTGPNDDRVRALVQLDRFVDSYLVVGRLIEPRVIAHMERVEGAVAEYRQLEGRASTLQITFTAIYLVVAFLLLLVAVWIGMLFADTIVTPISGLITAAERVRAGDLSARVTSGNADDELGILSRAFNRMTGQLQSQRAELVEANSQIDARRRFTEAVLEGVSAGVLGLDGHGRIDLANRSAVELLGLEGAAMAGRRLVDVVPEMAGPLEALSGRPGRQVEDQVKVRRGAELRTLLVRVAAEGGGDAGVGELGDGAAGGRGYVVTFDDITELLSAQRKAAWADVARRIAHEIKNPLTPIQLSAERLKRRYAKQIHTDPETFQICTDTIVRQVGDIGRMVDEFSAFARMPSPVMKEEDLVVLCQQAVALQRTAYPEIDFALEVPEERPPVPCDSRQVAQVLTNLLQNALDAIEGRQAEGEDGEAAPLPQGRIAMSVVFEDKAATVTIEDNGRGLPVEERDRLTEPYVTTRAKGTGLGLAIVKKIMEDHGGRLVLGDRPGGGARVRLVFPLGEAAGTAGPREGRAIHGA
ncbi:MAG: PAS domain-containing sensor histidine kinase [Azospirillaceae bacterium]